MTRHGEVPELYRFANNNLCGLPPERFLSPRPPRAPSQCRPKITAVSCEGAQQVDTLTVLLVSVTRQSAILCTLPERPSVS